LNNTDTILHATQQINNLLTHSTSYEQLGYTEKLHHDHN